MAITGGNHTRSPRGRISFMEVVAILGVLAAIGILFIQPHFEAKAYERVTGHKVSYWDAMFLDLRVQEPVKKD